LDKYRVENIARYVDFMSKKEMIWVVYLPTRLPELNPIELVFHILARRSRDWRVFGQFDGRSIIKNASRVMDEMSYDLIKRCCKHCGYNM
jgi:transposase